MAYYVRKIARAKWALLEHGAENVIENYKADTIANDMKTQGIHCPYGVLKAWIRRT